MNARKARRRRQQNASPEVTAAFGQIQELCGLANCFEKSLRFTWLLTQIETEHLQAMGQAIEDADKGADEAPHPYAAVCLHVIALLRGLWSIEGYTKGPVDVEMTWEQIARDADALQMYIGIELNRRMGFFEVDYPANPLEKHAGIQFKPTRLGEAYFNALREADPERAAEWEKRYQSVMETRGDEPA